MTVIFSVMMIHRVLDPSEVIVVRESTERGGFSSVDSCWEDTLSLNTREGRLMLAWTTVV